MQEKREYSEVQIILSVYTFIYCNYHIKIQDLYDETPGHFH